jgi:hypothetical protein
MNCNVCIVYVKMENYNNKKQSKNYTWYLYLGIFRHIVKDRTTRTPLKTGGELKCPGRVSSFCCTSGTCCVTLVTHLVISHEWAQSIMSADILSYDKTTSYIFILSTWCVLKEILTKYMLILICRYTNLSLAHITRLDKTNCSF